MKIKSVKPKNLLNVIENVLNLDKKDQKFVCEALDQALDELGDGGAFGEDCAQDPRIGV